jgi:uncharacterized sporulation protein YeaH/YhbH (DUF444 family)
MIARKDEDSPDDMTVSISEDDLRYRHVAEKVKESTNAVIFFVMDVSGSMTDEKRYLARSFFFLLYQFIRYKYENVEIVFISHMVDAEEVDEDKFFKQHTMGGTMVSPAVEKVISIASERYHPDSWNIYAFHCSDGDNWTTDNEKAVQSSRKLRDMCQLYGYCEIVPLEESDKWSIVNDSTLMNHYKILIDKKFNCVKIMSKDDVWPAFKKLFGGHVV